ncbi:ankyrin repeat and zinc finger domain-containing protein [Zymoseptoria brevis]|uniref:Ankyrin repeat and zinc finger domain-containing protein n=1 Tax=Zymoseptoria brevis TaxID=1047168 RepID=A0A0F4G5F6_9PEZI|nr:ankyrin repeat and zinc finger domain-containing protein [Zymoseptoria brevis]
MASTAEKLVQRPLYAFDLPEEILYTLQLKTQPTASPEVPSPSPSRADLTASDLQDGPANATSCNLCGLTFPTLLDQRSHIRSDLHGYNLKQKIRGKKAVNEADFETLVGQLDESISGSDSSESEDDEDDELGSGSKAKESTLSALLKRQAKITDGDADDAPTKKEKRGSGKPPLIWFSTPKLPSNTSLGFYRAIFPVAEQEQEDKMVEIIQRKQLAAKPAPQHQKKVEHDDEEDGGVKLPQSMIRNGTSAAGPHYFLCMIGGGQFAGMIVSLTPKMTKKAGIEDRSATVIAHKTFHRYTTRRKQGGSQSANDNSKGNAHSAGASIRRYNETALTQEVRDLLLEWKQLIDSAELIFIRATGSTNRRTLFGPYEDQVLSHKDVRIRGFPFNTRRATQAELMRAFVELTRVKVTTVDEAALAKQAEEAAAIATAKAEALANSKTTTPKTSKASKEDEEASLHTTQLQALIRRSKAPAMLSYIQSNNLSPDFRFFPAEQNHHAPTPLHLAAASNSPVCISSLLIKAGADPTVRNDDGKSAFDIAGDRATRDAFRLARSQLGEAKWEWDTANIPPALSHSEVEARTAREKEEKAVEDAAERQRREAEAERLRKEDKEREKKGVEKKFGKGRIMEAPALTAEERRAEQSKGMSDEMRMRLEREKRARAAEERMKRLAGK